jgi:uncharacterized protein with PQ loop repeat
MNVLSLFEAGTTVVGCIMAFALVPHILKMNRSKSSEGQSLLGAMILEFCYVWWFVYGLVFGLAAILIANTVAIVVGTVLIYTIIKWKLD